MNKRVISLFGNYYFPVFIFLIIITGDWDSVIRKLISFLFSILVIIFSLPKFKFNDKLKKSTLLIVLYIFICLLTIFTAVTPITSLYFFFRILVFFLIILSLFFWLNSYLRYRILLKTVVICGLCVAASIVFSFLTGNYVTELEGNIRVGGLFSNVNTAGFICYVSLIFVYLQYLETKKKRNFLSISLILIALILTGSRAGLLALAVSIVFYNLRFKLSKKLLIIIGVLFITVLSLGVYYKDTVINVLRLNKGLSARDVLYDTGLEIFKDHPIVGIGLGNLKEVGTHYIEKVEVSNWRKEQLLDIGIQSSHNAFLETAVEIGIFGSLILLLIVMTVGGQYYVSLKGKTNYIRNFYYLFWAFWGGIFVRSFFESNGIINRGWITIDIFFWIVYVTFLKFETIRKTKV